MSLLAACAAGKPRLCDPAFPTTAYRYSDADEPLPRHFVASPAGTVIFSDNTPRDNPVSNAGAALGRVLFYDPRLSLTDRVACASCHRQAFGFGDTVRFSPGIFGRHGTRRTLALVNARFNDHGRFFWDERATSLETQVLVPIQDSLEMGLELDSLERKLATTRYYPALFAAAFGSSRITRDRIAAALAQFVRSLRSSGSRFDSVFATGSAPDWSRLSAQEQQGWRLFNSSGCVNCHRAVTQFADKANNIGLDSLPGSFKPASLRNIAVRPPYMHDGRLKTLDAVVEFYSKEVRDVPGLDSRLRGRDGKPRRLNFTSEQTAALVAFLESLTDSAFLSAPKFSSPFTARDARACRP